MNCTIELNYQLIQLGNNKKMNLKFRPEVQSFLCIEQDNFKIAEFVQLEQHQHRNS